jgi:sortase A
VASSTITGKQLNRPTVWRIVEWFAWTAGISGLAVAGTMYFGGIASARRDVAQFEASRGSGITTAHPDQTLWSPKRILAWQLAVHREGPPPLAVLRIPRIGLEVPVLEGTDDSTLDRGAGHIEDTPVPGADGNAGIAGHRDGFFRGLKDVVPGDALELDLRRSTERYRIERIWIVGPDDVSVLDRTPARSVTLVTCYPFYFIGSAPQRYIVRAVLDPRSRS